LILAEESYAAELPYLASLPASRVLVLENKYQPAPDEQLPAGPRPAPRPERPLGLLFSGTISELNGVREAIQLTQELRRQWPGGARLHLIGFCQQPPLLAELKQLAAEQADWLTLTGGPRPVPHQQIVAAIREADFGLLGYQPHPSTARCRPTKLFEYLAHGLPVLAPANPLWSALLERYQAGLVVDFGQPTAAATAVAAAASRQFYPQGPPPEALWASEAKKLRHLLENLVLTCHLCGPFGRQPLGFGRPRPGCVCELVLFFPTPNFCPVDGCFSTSF
jgi:glycosyltransferase involved in cell wall biosynthesis